MYIHMLAKLLIKILLSESSRLLVSSGVLKLEVANECQVHHVVEDGHKNF